MQSRLAGKVIVVAGAGGIGNEMARRYASEGASVVLGDIDTDTAKAGVADVTAAGGTAIATELDGSSEASIGDAVKLALSEFGALHGFNANYTNDADGRTGKDILDLPLDVFDGVMNVNVRGYVLCTKQAVPALLQSGGGSIVYTSSGTVYSPEALRCAYVMSKSAIHPLARHVAKRWGPEGIRANVIAPGLIFHDKVAAKTTPEFQEMLRKMTALNELGHPRDIAAVSAMLMSEDGRYLTGQVFNVDGGLTMRA